MPSPSTQLSVDTFYAPQLTRANWRSTELVGKPVYNGKDERIGEIDELVLSNDGRVVAAIVGVGGFQGMAERKVSIAFPDIKMMRDSNGTARVSVDLSREMLQSAPEFKAPKMN